MAPEISDEALLTRNAIAAALTQAGYPTSPATLASKATRGGGPPYRRFGPRPLYQWGDALRWAQSRLGPRICSTSEAASHSLPARPDGDTVTPAKSPPRHRGRPRKQQSIRKEDNLIA
jgi:hypothetical protein